MLSLIKIILMNNIENIESGNPQSMVPESRYDSILKETFDNTFDPELQNVQFDPEKHLEYYASVPMGKYKYNNTRRLTMEELGLTNPNQTSHIGVSDPFPLFTEEAIRIMKMELLAKDTFLKYARFSHNSTGRDCIVRGYVKDDGKIVTPFTHAAWTHPKTMELVSTMAGIELEIVMDYEIAHANISMRDPVEARKEVESYNNEERDPSKDCVVNWHYDSYPFVCVLMISDTSTMIGGETCLRMGKSAGDNIAVVPGPTKGHAAILQGRLIEHIAPNPIGSSERITMVTSYRAKGKPDDSVLSTVKPEVNYGSRYDEFYSQWVTYRSDLVIENLDTLKKTMKKDGKFQKKKAMADLKAMEQYIKETYKQMEVSDQEWEEINERYEKFIN